LVVIDDERQTIEHEDPLCDAFLQALLDAAELVGLYPTGISLCVRDEQGKLIEPGEA
jgi:hypothetical protein